MLMLPTLTRGLATAAPTHTWALDDSWKPQWPVGSHSLSGVGVSHYLTDRRDPKGYPILEPMVWVTQRGNSSVAPVLLLNGTDGALLRSWGQDSVGLDHTASPPTWGSHGITVEECNYDCAHGYPDKSPWATTRIYIEDFTNHTVTGLNADGKKLFQMGTPGTAGNGTSPLQFGNVADGAVRSGRGSTPPPFDSLLYATDGDGGSANRVVKVAVHDDGSFTEVWATPHQYHNPHSIALHERSNLLIVADRGHAHVRLLRADDGTDLGVWDCGVGYGAGGVPFGVRTYSDERHPADILFVASMDNPQDGKNQRVSVIDVSGLSADAGTASPCTVIQTLKIEPAEYSGPHLLGVDKHTGDVYAALVSDKPRSDVLRFKCTGCTSY